MINKIQQAFDRAANTYDAHCHVQQHASIKLIHQLSSLQPHASRLLDLGCGTGLNTQFLAERYQYHDFYALDISPALLTKAEDRLGKLGIKTIEMDFDALTDFNYPFDIIFSNMAFQWSKDLSLLLKNLKSLLNEKSSLAFSLPLTGTLQEIESHCALNAFHDNDTILNLLTKNGYQLLFHENKKTALTFPHSLHALKSIKQIGANHVHDRTHKGLSSKSSFDQIILNKLTYVIGYFIARLTP